MKFLIEYTSKSVKISKDVAPLYWIPLWDFVGEYFDIDSIPVLTELSQEQQDDISWFFFDLDHPVIDSEEQMFCQHGGNAKDCIVCNPKTGWDW